MMNGTSTITPNSILNDPHFKFIDKWMECSLMYKDFIRLGLVSSHGNHPASLALEQACTAIKSEVAEDEFDAHSANIFRLCSLNSNYQLCKSYPALFVVAKETTDDCVKKNVKCHRQNR